MPRAELENLKSVQMAVRMTIGEREEVDRKCKELGLKPTDYLRDHTVRLYNIQPLLNESQPVKITSGDNEYITDSDRIPFNFMRKPVKKIFTVRDTDRIHIILEEG